MPRPLYSAHVYAFCGGVRARTHLAISGVSMARARRMAVEHIVEWLSINASLAISEEDVVLHDSLASGGVEHTAGGVACGARFHLEQAIRER